MNEIDVIREFIELQSVAIEAGLELDMALDGESYSFNSSFFATPYEVKTLREVKCFIDAYLIRGVG